MLWKRLPAVGGLTLALICLPVVFAAGGDSAAEPCQPTPECHHQPTTTLTPPASTSTTTTPSGSLFFEDFTGDTTADFTSRFDWSVADLSTSGRSLETWQGHHNDACEGPTTERVLQHAPVSNTDPGPEFWLCGPGGDATDHIMTSNGRNNVFGVTAFSPKPSFTGRRVCFDVNLTVSFGQRRWWEVQILPAHYVTNAIGMLQMGTINSSSQERGTAYLAWGAGIGGTLQNRILPLGGLLWDFTGEINHVRRGNEPDPNTAGFDVSQFATPIFEAPFSTRFVTEDRATRAHHCWTDNGDGTMTIRQARPAGLPDFVATFNGSFPQPFRVIFSDHNYDSGKDGSLASQTFHWDNLSVE
jgi:hypothetical protein